jgi:hypothetical protein
MSNFMGMQQAVPAAIGVGTIFSLGGLCSSQIVTWLGLNILKVGVLSAAGFSAVAGMVAVVSDVFFKECLFINDLRLRLPMSLFIGTLCSYALSHVAYAIGFIAIPMTLPSALILTISGFAMATLFALLFYKIRPLLPCLQGIEKGILVKASNSSESPV